MADSGIYEIVNLVNGKRYIGSAVDIKRRWRQHQRLLGLGSHYSPALQRAWHKYGPSQFEFRVVLQCPRENLLREEQAALDARWPEYNNCPTAGSSLGRRHSEETRQKIGDRKRGQSLPARSKEYRQAISEKWKGKQKSSEHMAALQAGRRATVRDETSLARTSASLKLAYAEGRKSRERSPEYREKIAASLRGRKLSPEHKAAVAASMRGKKRGPYKKRAAS